MSVIDQKKFDLLHPRAKGGEHGGEFIDVLGNLQAMGATHDKARNVWVVPKERRADLEKMLDDAGFDAVNVPVGMRPATDEERRTWKVPPAWTDVFIAHDVADYEALVNRPIVKGRDAKGRMQSRYSDKHIAEKAAEKYARVAAFEKYMPSLTKDMSDTAFTDDTAAALMVMRKMGIRPGSDSDTKTEHKAYGISNMERRHVQVTGDTVRFQFVAKEGIHQDLSIEDAELAKVIKRRLADKAGGDKLFPGTNDQKMRDWVQERAPGHRPYDFRTRLATLTAMQHVSIMPVPQSEKEMKKAINVVGDEVARLLGNKRKQALESYINPTVFRKWREAVDNIEQGGGPPS